MLYLYYNELSEVELFELTELLEIETVLTIKLCTHAKLDCLNKNWLEKNLDGNYTRMLRATCN